MNTLLAVFLGGGLGSLSRYGISILMVRLQLNNFPWATLISNTASAFIIGILMGSQLVGKDADSSIWKYFLAVGFCGGFSTFSAFSMETVELAQNGNMHMAAINGLANLFFSITAASAGILISKSI